jgi:hypothetical protein
VGGGLEAAEWLDGLQLVQPGVEADVCQRAGDQRGRLRERHFDRPGLLAETVVDRDEMRDRSVALGLPLP